MVDNLKNYILELVIINILFMFGIALFYTLDILKTEFDIDKCYVSTFNLSYSYYNVTTKKVKYIDSGIPVYNNICENGTN